MRLIIIRHGETDTNRAGFALGRADVPLNARGRHQALCIARALESCPISAIYTSPLQRAVATASPLAEAKGVPLSICEDLTEMDVGHLDGMSFPEIQQQYSEFLQHWRGAEVGSVAMPGGESLRQVQERAWSAIEKLLQVHPDESVAIVSHNFVILMLLCRSLGIELANFRRLRHDLAAITVLDIRQERSLLMRLNETCHLSAIEEAS